MELTVSGVDGLSEDNIVSVRLGDTRRQAPLHKLRKQPLRFPTCKREDCEEPMRIEVMQVVASCRLALLPTKTDYWIPLTDSTGARNDSTTTNRNSYIGMQVQFSDSSDPTLNKSAGSTSTRLACNTPSAALPACPNAAAAARGYLETHGVLQYVQSLLHAVIQEKPADPFNFMSQQLLASTSTPAATTEPILQPDVLQRSSDRQPGEDLQSDVRIGVQPITAADKRPPKDKTAHTSLTQTEKGTTAPQSAQISEMRVELEQLREKFAAAEEAKAREAQNATAFSQEVAELKQELQQLNAAAAESKAAVETAAAHEDAANSRLADLKLEVEQLRGALQNSEKATQQETVAAGAMNRMVADLQSEVEKLRESAAKESTSASSHNEELAQLRRDVERLTAEAKDMDSLKSEMSRLLVAVAEDEQLGMKIKMAIGVATSANASASAELSEVKEHIQEALMKSELDGRLQRAVDEVTGASNEHPCKTNSTEQTTQATAHAALADLSDIKTSLKTTFIEAQFDGRLGKVIQEALASSSREQRNKNLVETCAQASAHAAQSSAQTATIVLSDDKSTVKDVLHAEVEGFLSNAVDEALAVCSEKQLPQTTNSTEHAAQGSADTASTDLSGLRNSIKEALLTGTADGRLDSALYEAFTACPEKQQPLTTGSTEQNKQGSADAASTDLSGVRKSIKETLLNAVVDGRLDSEIKDAGTLCPEKQQPQTTSLTEQTTQSVAHAASTDLERPTQGAVALDLPDPIRSSIREALLNAESEGRLRGAIDETLAATQKQQPETTNLAEQTAQGSTDADSASTTDVRRSIKDALLRAESEGRLRDAIDETFIATAAETTNAAEQTTQGSTDAVSPSLSEIKHPIKEALLKASADGCLTADSDSRHSIQEALLKAKADGTLQRAIDETFTASPPQTSHLAAQSAQGSTDAGSPSAADVRHCIREALLRAESEGRLRDAIDETFIATAAQTTHAAEQTTEGSTDAYSPSLADVKQSIKEALLKAEDDGHLSTDSADLPDTRQSIEKALLKAEADGSLNGAIDEALTAVSQMQQPQTSNSKELATPGLADDAKDQDASSKALPEPEASLAAPAAREPGEEKAAASDSQPPAPVPVPVPPTPPPIPSVAPLPAGDPPPLPDAEVETAQAEKQAEPDLADSKRALGVAIAAAYESGQLADALEASKRDIQGFQQDATKKAASSIWKVVADASRSGALHQAFSDLREAPSQYSNAQISEAKTNVADALLAAHTSGALVSHMSTMHSTESDCAIGSGAAVGDKVRLHDQDDEGCVLERTTTDLLVRMADGAQKFCGVEDVATVIHTPQKETPCLDADRARVREALLQGCATGSLSSALAATQKEQSKEVQAADSAHHESASSNSCPMTPRTLEVKEKLRQVLIGGFESGLLAEAIKSLGDADTQQKQADHESTSSQSVDPTAILEAKERVRQLIVKGFESGLLAEAIQSLHDAGAQTGSAMTADCVSQLEENTRQKLKTSLVEAYDTGSLERVLSLVLVREDSSQIAVPVDCDTGVSVGVDSKPVVKAMEEAGSSEFSKLRQNVREKLLLAAESGLLDRILHGEEANVADTVLQSTVQEDVCQPPRGPNAEMEESAAELDNVIKCARKVDSAALEVAEVKGELHTVCETVTMLKSKNQELHVVVENMRSQMMDLQRENEQLKQLASSRQ